MCKRVHLWHRSRLSHLRHVLLQSDVLEFFWRNAHAEGCTNFKEMHHSFSRESFYVFEDLFTQGFDSTMSTSKSVLQIHWLPMFCNVFQSHFEKMRKQAKLPNLGPKPSTDAKQTIITIKQPKATLQPSSARSGKELGPSLLRCCASPSEKTKTNEKTTNQETKQQRKGKKPKNWENRKSKIAHSKGGE